MVAKPDKKLSTRPVLKEDLEVYINRELAPMVEKLRLTLDALLSRYLEGEGSPEGVVEADRGALYQRQDGIVTQQLYIKTTDASSTGWVALA